MLRIAAVEGTFGSLLHVWELVTVAFAFAAMLAAGFVVRITQKRAEEWRDLATARGEQVDDLREQISELRAEIGEVRGEINAMKSIKAQEIAEQVVSLLGERN